MKLSAALLAATALAAAPTAFAQEPMEIEDLFNVRTVSGAAVSPDGETVAYTLSRMRNVLEGEENGPARTEVRVAFGPNDNRLFVDEGVGASQVSYLGADTLLYIAEKDGTRVLFSLPLGGGAAETFFSYDEDIRSYDLADDGDILFFTAQDPLPKEEEALRVKGFDANVIDADLRFTRLYRADLSAASPSAARVDLEGEVSAFTVAPDGETVAVAVAETPMVGDDIINRTIKIVEGESGEVLKTVPTEGKIGPFAFSPDGTTLAFLAGVSRYDSVAHTLGVMDVSSREMEFLTADDEADEIDFFWVGNDEIRVLAHEGVGSKVYTLRLDGSRSDEAQHEDFVVLALDGSDAGTAAVASSPTYPPELFAGDTLEKWTDHNEWLDGVTLYPQRTVRYEAGDGTEVEGLLIEPAERRGRFRRGRDQSGAPLITVVHGGPESHYPNGWLTAYSMPGQIGAGDGYAVFYPNYRGSTGRGQAFAALDQQDPPAAEFDDITAGIDYLIEEGIADGDRVGITGGSYGGYASAWAATKLSERFAASVVFVALTDLVSFTGTTDITEEMIDSHFRISPEDEPDIYRAQSPVTWAEGSTTPTLILHGEADPRVHPAQSLQLYRTMQRVSDAPVRLVTYPAEGHGNRRAAAQFDYAHRMMRWFDTYLMEGKRDADLPPRRVPAVDALSADEGAESR